MYSQIKGRLKISDGLFSITNRTITFAVGQHVLLFGPD